MPAYRLIAPTIAAAVALAAAAAPASSATTILFVGNSFTYGDPAGAAPLVREYRPDTVTDLNGTHIGGVPALFKAMTQEAGLDYEVSLETSPGKGVDWHYENRLAAIATPFDKVVLQSYSTLDGAHPGDPATLIKYSGLLAQAFHDRNRRWTCAWPRPGRAPTRRISRAAPGTASRSIKWRSTCAPATTRPTAHPT